MTAKVAAGFNRLSAVYDGLAAVMSGNQIKKSQLHFLGRIKDRSRILILGGGTGWLLSCMLADRSGCEVWYIDISDRMIREARKRCVGNNKVHFITGTEADVPMNTFFDIVITNFYLDLFTEADAEKTVQTVMHRLSAEAMWIVTDFADQGKWWQKVLLKMMYHFFRFTCDIDARWLPRWQRIMDAHLERKEERTFFKGFIVSAVYFVRR